MILSSHTFDHPKVFITIVGISILSTLKVVSLLNIHFIDSSPFKHQTILTVELTMDIHLKGILHYKKGQSL